MDNDFGPLGHRPTELIAALAKVAAKLPAVPKASEAQAFKGGYRSYDDLMNAAGHLLAKEGIIPIVDDVDIERETQERKKSNGDTWVTTLTTLKVAITFHHTSGERLTVQSTGMSTDNGAFAVGIARTYALKDVLSRTLMVAFEGDEEEARPQPEGQVIAKPTLAEEVMALATELNEEEVKALKAWLKSNGMPTKFNDVAKSEAALDYTKLIIKKLKHKLEWPKDYEADDGEDTAETEATDD